ncbi:Skp1 family, dimerization domain-containing protein [Hypoxylon crocopeplum]|nr:Skp1 family, dimerization domain-containing protein [Hypoxylon crocopeplum]
MTISRMSGEMSKVIGYLLEDLYEGGETPPAIPITEVNTDTLQRLFEFCERYSIEQQKKQQKKQEEEKDLTEEEKKKREADENSEYERIKRGSWEGIPQWCKDFLMNLDQSQLMSLILAANYLDIPVVLDYGTKTIAHQVKDMTTEQMREFFGVENDFTPEEEEQIRKENEVSSIESSLSPFSFVPGVDTS